MLLEYIDDTFPTVCWLCFCFHFFASNVHSALKVSASLLLAQNCVLWGCVKFEEASFENRSSKFYMTGFFYFNVVYLNLVGLVTDP